MTTPSTVANPTLPPGMSRARFLQAVAELRAAVGAANVIVDEQRLRPYRKIMVPGLDAEHAASGAVMVDDLEQLRAVLDIARRHRLPLWTVSTGKNFGYGTAAPATPGQLVLDLKRMNRILEVDAELGTVLIEPGVTYQQLSDHLKALGLPFQITAPGAGPLVGPVGQALERGRGYTPYGDQFGNVCGLEVMLSTGELLRTGSGSIAGTRAWQSDKYGIGPYLDGLFSQSNFGIVTKLGLWLMPKPQAYRPFMVGFRGHGDVGRAVEITQRLRMAGVLQAPTVVGHTMYLVAQSVRRADVFRGLGGVTDEWHSTAMRDKGGVVWAVNGALYGSAARVEADWAAVQDAFRDSGGLLLTDRELGGDPIWQHMRGLMNGEMSLQEYAIYNWRGGGGSAWFAPVMAARGRDALETAALGKAILLDHGFDYMGGYIVNPRDMVQIVELLYDRTDEAERERAYRCFQTLVQRFGAQGYGLYRTNISFMRQAAALQGPVRNAVQRRLKKALDPAGILSPGKSGILPL